MIDGRFWNFQERHTRRRAWGWIMPCMLSSLERAVCFCPCCCDLNGFRFNEWKFLIAHLVVRLYGLTYGRITTYISDRIVFPHYSRTHAILPPSPSFLLLAAAYFSSRKNKGLWFVVELVRSFIIVWSRTGYQHR